MCYSLTPTRTGRWVLSAVLRPLAAAFRHAAHHPVAPRAVGRSRIRGETQKPSSHVFTLQCTHHFVAFSFSKLGEMWASPTRPGKCPLKSPMKRWSVLCQVVPGAWE